MVAIFIMAQHCPWSWVINSEGKPSLLLGPFCAFGTYLSKDENIHFHWFLHLLPFLADDCSHTFPCSVSVLTPYLDLPTNFEQDSSLLTLITIWPLFLVKEQLLRFHHCSFCFTSLLPIANPSEASICVLGHFFSFNLQSNYSLSMLK